MTEAVGRDMRAIGARFQVPGSLLEARPHGTGHINETWAATYDQAGTPVTASRTWTSPCRLVT